MVSTVVHLLRHGEVDNPRQVLYGRLPNFHLSPLGRRMAERVAESVAERKLTHVVASPLERAQETAGPIAEIFGLPIATDDRLIEAGNTLEGQRLGGTNGAFRNPLFWWHFRNPFRPSWGEPYEQIVVRMLAAMADARKVAEGREALMVSHQLPIWSARSYATGQRLWHDPRRRQCTLASLTSFTYVGERIVSVDYSEPAGDLLPPRVTKHFVAGA